MFSFYKKDNDPSIILEKEGDETNLEDYTELDGLYGFNLFSKELKDLGGNLVDLEELVKE